jgi:hypothetical protein
MSDTFRKAYRELTDAEKEHIEKIKVAAEKLKELINRIPFWTEDMGRQRFIALAITNLEQAVMWAEKAAT